jgi:hypothetical protein
MSRPMSVLDHWLWFAITTLWHRTDEQRMTSTDIGVVRGLWITSRPIARNQGAHCSMGSIAGQARTACASLVRHPAPTRNHRSSRYPLVLLMAASSRSSIYGSGPSVLNGRVQRGLQGMAMRIACQITTTAAMIAGSAATAGTKHGSNLACLIFHGWCQQICDSKNGV